MMQHLAERLLQILPQGVITLKGCWLQVVSYSGVYFLILTPVVDLLSMFTFLFLPLVIHISASISNDLPNPSDNPAFTSKYC